MTHTIMVSATTCWPNAGHYAEGFATAGLEVAALAPLLSPVHAHPSTTRGYFYDPFRPETSFRRAIENAQPELIVSCDERALGVLLRLYRQECHRNSALVAVIKRSLGAPEAYPAILARHDALSQLRAMGARVPPTLPVESEAVLEDRIAAVGLPAVIKADETCGGEGVAIVRTIEEARAAFRGLVAPRRIRHALRTIRSHDLHFFLESLSTIVRRISIQAFVEGHVAASAFAAHEGNVVASFHYDVLEAEKDGVGPPSRIRRVECREMDDVVSTVAGHFGLTGAHGLDFIRDAKGKPHLIEINPRATRGGTLPFGLGRDIPYALASTLGAQGMGIRAPIRSGVVDFGAKPATERPALASAPRLSRLVRR